MTISASYRKAIPCPISQSFFCGLGQTIAAFFLFFFANMLPPQQLNGTTPLTLRSISPNLISWSKTKAVLITDGGHGIGVRIVRSFSAADASFVIRQCSQTFADVASARLHAQSQHLGIRFPCPLADRFQCFSQTFPSQNHARLHAESQHLKIRFPCPLADQFYCSQTFTRKRGARAHARWKHEGVGYPCPLAEQFQCSQTFRRESDARNHIDVHQGISYPCPAAESITALQHSSWSARLGGMCTGTIKPSFVAGFQGAWRGFKHVPVFLLM